MKLRERPPETPQVHAGFEDCQHVRRQPSSQTMRAKSPKADSDKTHQRADEHEGSIHIWIIQARPLAPRIRSSEGRPEARRRGALAANQSPQNRLPRASHRDAVAVTEPDVCSSVVASIWPALWALALVESPSQAGTRFSRC